MRCYTLVIQFSFLIHALFYKNNFIRTTRLKFAQKLRTRLRTIVPRVRFRCKCNCKFLLKNTTHHVITCSVSLQVFLQFMEKLSEQRRKSKLCPTCFMTVLNYKNENSLYLPSTLSGVFRRSLHFHLSIIYLKSLNTPSSRPGLLCDFLCHGFAWLCTIGLK